MRFLNRKITMCRFLCFVIIASFLHLDAKLEDHFKKAEGKSNIHKMANIDFIYMINLDRRPEKFAMSCKQLQPYGIVPYRFSAVNGWQLSVEAINDIGLPFKPGMTPLMGTTYPMHMKGLQSHEFMKDYGKVYFSHCLAKGPMGCYLSHLSILKDAWDSGYNTIWVMEDDIEVVRDPNIISGLIIELDRLTNGQWDVLFTDQDYRDGVGHYVVASGAPKRPDMDCSFKERYSYKYTVKQDISPNFRRISARFGTHSMIIRRSGIKKLLNFAYAHKIYCPIDLENYLPEGIKRYSFRYDVVTNMLNSLSDNGAPRYNN